MGNCDVAACRQHILAGGDAVPATWAKLTRIRLMANCWLAIRHTASQGTSQIRQPERHVSTTLRHPGLVFTLDSPSSPSAGRSTFRWACLVASGPCSRSVADCRGTPDRGFRSERPRCGLGQSEWPATQDIGLRDTERAIQESVSRAGRRRDCLNRGRSLRNLNPQLKKRLRADDLTQFSVSYWSLSRDEFVFDRFRPSGVTGCAHQAHEILQFVDIKR